MTKKYTAEQVERAFYGVGQDIPPDLAFIREYRRSRNAEHRDQWKTIGDLQEERGRLERVLSWERGNCDRAARERDRLKDAIADYGLMAVKQEDGTVRLEPTPEAELSANVVKAYTVEEKIDAIVRYLTED